MSYLLNLVSIPYNLLLNSKYTWNTLYAYYIQRKSQYRFVVRYSIVSLIFNTTPQSTTVPYVRSSRIIIIIVLVLKNHLSFFHIRRLSRKDDATTMYSVYIHPSSPYGRDFPFAYTHLI